MKEIVKREITNELVEGLSADAIKVIGFAEVGAQGCSEYVILLSDDGSRVFYDEGSFSYADDLVRIGGDVEIEALYKVAPFLADFLGVSFETTQRGHFKLEEGEWVHLDADLGNHFFIRIGMVDEFLDRFGKMENAYLTREGVAVAVDMLRGKPAVADHMGAMIGAIVGDIAGSRFEFHNRKSKKFTLLVAPNDVPPAPSEMKTPLPKKRCCRFTDDTVMTLAVAEAVTNWRLDGSGSYDALSNLVVESMQAFGKKYPRAGYGGHFSHWLRDPNPKPYKSWGNGAAMRVSACGCAAQSLEEVKKLSAAVTGVTHNHPEGFKGAEATAVAVYLARQGKSKDEIREVIVKDYYPLGFKLDDIRSEYNYDISCQGSVPPALEAFFESTGFEDAIRNAISIGGDSDTLGAICGAVAGAYYGVPDAIRDQAVAFLTPHLREVLTRVESSLA